MIGEAAAKLVWDARQATERVARLVDGCSFDEYPADEVLRWAVERQMMVLGEALAALRRVDPLVADKIPDLARIVAFRNVLVHGYAGVDDRLVWGDRTRSGRIATCVVATSRTAELRGRPVRIERR
ncbi:MAG TPA: DUF86 domain-containing protein [Acetobacteraceae bacterium]|jgi:uncharacterized protein with HEPN domain